MNVIRHEIDLVMQTLFHNVNVIRHEINLVMHTLICFVLVGIKKVHAK